MKRLLALLSVIVFIFTAIFAVGYLLKPEATQKNENEVKNHFTAVQKPNFRSPFTHGLLKLGFSYIEPYVNY